MFKWLFKKKGCAKHMNNKLEVIGIDHGWSMMKTISQVFVTGVKEITTTPALFGDVLEYEGKFYKVGTVRQEVKDTKVEDDSFYLLTLAAVAKELKRRGLAEAKVFLAVGLPLTRFGAEKNDFIKYLTKNKRVSFKYENEPYYIEIDDVAVFPQCYAAVVDKIPTMAKKTLIVDIGSWTIDIMPVINKSPDESKCVTIPKGLITCMRSINEQCVRQLNGEVDESEIQNIMRYGKVLESCVPVTRLTLAIRNFFLKVYAFYFVQLRIAKVEHKDTDNFLQHLVRCFYPGNCQKRSGCGNFPEKSGIRRCPVSVCRVWQCVCEQCGACRRTVERFSSWDLY